MRHTLACLAACCACGCAAADLRPVREELAIVRDAVREQSAETARLHAEVRRALASGRREDLGMTAPADGLYLEHIQLENAGHDAWPAIDEGALVA